jgi:predicted small secreted protein
MLARRVTMQTNNNNDMKLNFKTSIITLFLTAFLAAIGVGCKHTAHGVGEDVEKAGEKIQEKTR